MGVYQFSSDVNDKIFKKLLDNEYDDLMIGLRKYVDPTGKTIDEVLESLEYVEESMEDRIGAIGRHMKYTQGKQKLSEKSEEDLAEAAYVSFLISKLKSLKNGLQVKIHLRSYHLELEYFSTCFEILLALFWRPKIYK